MAWLADPTTKLSKCSLTERCYHSKACAGFLSSGWLSFIDALGMDPKALLDYALFQLTPTRTRCDLVVFSGGISEKLASGLVEPFVHHLKFAKDQIPKGGYSITLQPPKTDAFWFTKATFERFVRFVSTPEVLERFARLEKEISQIESSVQSSEFASNNVAGQAEEGSLSSADEISKQSINSSKLKGEGGGTDDAAHEENSKIRLQRLLETRKGLLRKEQAMAYARALAAGFELDNIDDLIFFAEAFGASRLREACTDFKELCKKKHKDGLWMDELAAMEACSPSDLSFLGTSGIMLASESTPSCQNNMLNFQNNGVSGVKLVSNGSLDVSSADSTISQANSDSSKDNNVPASDQVSSTAPKSQGQMPWPNQFPHFMFNFQNPVQQMPPYQAYPFPGLQPIPPYYPGNMHHPQNMDESGHGLTREPHRHRHQRSFSRKEKSPTAGLGTSEEDEQTESSGSDTGTDSEMIALQNRMQSPKEQPYKKRHGKKSSKTVVIRNINYITSNRRNEEKDEVSYDSSSIGDELVDKDSLKQKVEDVVGSFEKHHKPTLNNKKRGGNKSSSFVNGSNGSADQELENDPLTVSEGGEGSKHWDAFQNLLMRGKESTTGAIESQQSPDVLDEHFSVKSSIEIDTSANFHSVQYDSEKVQRQLNFEADSFFETERNEVDEGRLYLEDFGNGETLCSSMKRSDCAEEALLLPQRSEELRSILLGTLSNGTESSIIKNGKAEDWFIVNHSGKSESQDITIEQAMFDGSYALSSEGGRSDVEKSKRIIPIDDSFMVQAQTSVDDQYDSHWKTDISMVSDIIIASQRENGIPDASKNKTGLSFEPDDLCVVLARDSGFESAGESRSPELDYGIVTSFTESDKKNAGVDTNLVEEKIPMNSKSVSGKNSAGPGPNNSARQSRPKGLRESLTKSKSDVLAKSKKPLPTNRPVIQKSKLEKEEEARKRMEELVIQRQKRIAERTAASGLTPTISKKVPVGSKGTSPKYDKHRRQSTTNVKKTNARMNGAVNV